MDQRIHAASPDRASGPAVGRQPAAAARPSQGSVTPQAASLLQLQRLAGNRAVAGAVRGVPTIQRWAVGYNAATEDCVAAANWITAHTPHPRGAWARTFVSFSRTGNLQTSGTGTNLTATVADPAVTHSKRVDMPTWSPTRPSMVAAWSRASTELRAHEATHEQKGDEWRTEMQSRLASFSAPVRSRAAGEAELGRQWAQWLVDHQADQDTLDPFTVTLDCSDAAGSEESASLDLTGELSMGEEFIP